MNLNITLDQSSSLPLYRQISLAIARQIETGELQQGSPLPSTRQLASNLKVGRVTAITAYEDLLSRGLIKSTVGSGTVVCGKHLATAPQIAPKQPVDSAAIHLSGLGSNIEGADHPITSADIQLLNRGHLPQDLLPLAQWRNALLKATRYGVIDPQLIDAGGYKPLKQELAAYLERARGLSCKPEQVFIFSSAQQPLHLLASLFVQPGSTCAVEEPGFQLARRSFKCHGATVESLPVDRDGASLSRLLSGEITPSVVYLTTSRQDPTGAVLTMERRLELIRWAKHKDVSIFEDDFDHEFRYTDRPLPALQAMDRQGKTFYLGNFWRTLHPLTSIGYLVCPESFIEVIEKGKLLAERESGLFDQAALQILLASGQFERHIHRTRESLKQRRISIIQSLTQVFGRECIAGIQSGGLHQRVILNFPIEDELVERLAWECGLPLVSTAAYYSKPRKNEFLFSFSSVSDSDIGNRMLAFRSRLETAAGLTPSSSQDEYPKIYVDHPASAILAQPLT